MPEVMTQQKASHAGDIALALSDQFELTIVQTKPDIGPEVRCTSICWL
jgi:hypothetical protein